MPTGHAPACVHPVTTLRARGCRSRALSLIPKVQNALKDHEAFQSLFDGKIQVKKKILNSLGSKTVLNEAVCGPYLFVWCDYSPVFPQTHHGV